MKKTANYPFDTWKESSRKYNLSRYHVSMNGETQKVTVTPLKTKK